EERGLSGAGAGNETDNVDARLMKPVAQRPRQRVVLLEDLCANFQDTWLHGLASPIGNITNDETFYHKAAASGGAKSGTSGRGFMLQDHSENDTLSSLFGIS